jgi:hypothetical protein
MTDVIWCTNCKQYGHLVEACPGIDTGKLPLVPEDTVAKERQDIIAHAEFLIANGYVKELPLDKLIERMESQKKDPTKLQDKFDSYDLD